MDLNVYKLHSNYQDLFTASWSDEWIFFFRGDVTLKKYYWAASDVLNSISRLTDALFRRTKGVSFWNSAYSDGENVRQMDDETWC